jgi:uncharacterized protein YbcI
MPEEHTAGAGEARSLSPAAQISNRMVRLMANYVGRGPTKARTTLNTNIVLVVFAETMTRAEQNLAAVGQGDSVRSMRETLQRSMREEAVAAVEEIVGRRVVAYMGGVDTDANVASLVFTFEPHPESGHVEVAEADERQSP